MWPVFVFPVNSPVCYFLEPKPHSFEMASYPSLIWRIISLLLLIIQDRVGSTSLGGDIIADTNLTLNGSPYTVSQDLAVAENTTLTIQPGVQLHFDVGVGLQIKGSLEAKGNPYERIVFTKTPTNTSVNMDDLNVTAPYNDGIRLSDRKNYRVGRLEIFQRGQWGTVCDDSWDMRNTEVNKITRSLGSTYLCQSLEDFNKLFIKPHHLNRKINKLQKT